METIIFDNLSEIKKTKKELELKLNVSISINGKNIVIKGSPINEYTAFVVLDAINLGFSTKKALMLKDQDIIFSKINIKDHTRRKKLHDVRARIIGTEGKTKRTIEDIADSDVVLQGNTIGLIGPAESVNETITALINLIKGSKQANVYKYLEDMNRIKKIQESDLGIKPEKYIKPKTKGPKKKNKQ